MNRIFSNNTARSRFEYHQDGYIAFANYRLRDSVLSIDYVEAPPELRGKGAAGQLMRSIMEHARAENLKVTPICDYAVSWLRRHGEFADLIG